MRMINKAEYINFFDIASFAESNGTDFQYGRAYSPPSGSVMAMLKFSHKLPVIKTGRGVKVIYL